MILRIENISKHFGGVMAVDSCSFSVKKGSLTGLIGPNGAGKTTLFNIISGLITADSSDSGDIFFENTCLTRLTVHQRARLGICRSFQTIRLWPELTTIDNLLLAFQERKTRFFHAFFPHRVHTERLRHKALQLLASVGLEELADAKAYTLSYGQQKLVALLRTEASEASLVLLDEPTAGVNPTLIRQIESMIRRLQKEGRTFLIVEHNMPFIMRLCDTIVVMDRGREIMEGRPEEVQRDERVLEAYLGKRREGQRGNVKSQMCMANVNTVIPDRKVASGDRS